MPPIDRFARRFDTQQEQKRQNAPAEPEGGADDAEPPVEQARKTKPAGRNDPCPCGSGRKFKQCCGKAS